VWILLKWQKRLWEVRKLLNVVIRDLKERLLVNSDLWVIKFQSAAINDSEERKRVILGIGRKKRERD
jgi:hypothetical protein